MDYIFYYFLRSSRTNKLKSDNPYCINFFLGDVGEYIEIDGVGYYIDDYVVEIPIPEYDEYFI